MTEQEFNKMVVWAKKIPSELQQKQQNSYGFFRAVAPHITCLSGRPYNPTHTLMANNIAAIAQLLPGYMQDVSMHNDEKWLQRANVLNGMYIYTWACLSESTLGTVQNADLIQLISNAFNGGSSDLASIDSGIWHTSLKALSEFTTWCYQHEQEETQALFGCDIKSKLVMMKENQQQYQGWISYVTDKVNSVIT